MRSCADTYVRIPTYVYLCMYTYVRIPMHVYLCTYTYARIPMYVYLCTYTYARIPMYVYLCTYTYVRIPMHVYLFTYTYVRIPCMYTYVHLYLSTSRYSEQFLWHICKSINRTFRPQGFLQLLHCVYQSRASRLPTSNLHKSVWRETAASCVHTYVHIYHQCNS